MEKSVGHVRGQLGKKDRRGMEKKFEHVCEEIPNRPTEENVRQELRTGSAKTAKSKSRSHEWLHAESPLIKGYKMVHDDMQIWHHTEEPRIKKADQTNTDATRAAPNSFEMADGETLNPAVLSCFDIGLDRARKYMKTYYIDTPFRVDRSEKDVQLTRILATSLDRRLELEKSIYKATSVSEDELDKAVNKDELRKELDSVIDVEFWYHD